MEVAMTAYNVVRFKVKPGQEQKFLDAHRNAKRDFAGFNGGALVKTGDRHYCFIGRWNSMDAIAGARPKMKNLLDTFRGLLEDVGGGMGVTDPVSGEVVVELPPSKG
ncbi:MAG: putative quinol monooxygenase [Methylocella sp.]